MWEQSLLSCPPPQLSCLGHSPTRGSSADARVPSWQHTLACPYPQHSAPHQVPKKGSENVGRQKRGKLCPLKLRPMLGLLSKESQ